MLTMLCFSAKYNLIILGSTSENSWTSRYLDKIPLEFESSKYKHIIALLFAILHGTLNLSVKKRSVLFVLYFSLMFHN